MSNKTKTPLVPKLRFPEFREAGEWVDTPLGKLLVSKPDYGVNAAAVPFSANLPKYLRITDISQDGRYLPGKKVSVDLDAAEESYLDIGDIVLARTGASVGKSYRYREEDGKLVFAGFLIRIKPNQSDTDSIYLANFLTSNQFWNWVATTSARSGQPGINSYEYSLLPIPLPPKLAEQQRIADCLSSLDELIAAQARKVNTLKTHRKGLMQQLFPREGETQPRLRFPEFQNAGEWSEGKLINLSNEPLSNGVFNDPKRVGSGYKLINVSDMYIETSVDESRLALLELSQPEFAANQVIAGDIFFTRSSLVKSGIAVSNIYLGASEDVTYDGHLIRFRPNMSKVVPLFAHYLFKTAPIREQLIARGKTATMTTIGQADVASVALLYPNRAEQQCIADCLRSKDTLITTAAREFETLKTHKKGLMQQLFPALDETPI